MLSELSHKQFGTLVLLAVLSFPCSKLVNFTPCLASLSKFSQESWNPAESNSLQEQKPHLIGGFVHLFVFHPMTGMILPI